MSNLVSIFGTNLLDLVGIQSIADTDYLIVQKNTNGDTKTRKILWSDVKSLIELSDSQKIVETSAAYTADGSEDAIFCTGTFTVTLPLTSNAHKSILIKSMSGTVTVASSSGVSASPLTTNISRRYYPISSGWESA